MSLVIKEYECVNCGLFEATQNHDEMYEYCPECDAPVERIIGLPAVSKLADPRTVGTMMERNNRRNPLTREKLMGSESEFNKKSEQAAKMKKINNMTAEQKERYIMTGKM